MTIYGWDMSHYDAPSLGSALAEGITFITHKAGGDGHDPELAPWWKGVKGLDPARYLLGTYWIPRPDLHPSASGTADDWLATLDADCPGWRDREHALEMDAERWPAGGDRTKPNKGYLQTLGNRLVAKMPRLRPLCYASEGQYGDSLKGLTFPLWNANYPSSTRRGFKDAYAHAGGDSGPGWVAYSGQMPVLWQYTSSATIGGQTTSDANAFRGTLDQLKALVAPGWKDDLEMTEAEMDKLAGKIAAALLKSDTVPVTPANGVSTTWMTQTALGDMTTKLGEISRSMAKVVENTTPLPPTA